MRVIRLKEVLTITGIARSSVYRYISAGTFPVPISLGFLSKGWMPHCRNILEQSRFS